MNIRLHVTKNSEGPRNFQTENTKLTWSKLIFRVFFLSSNELYICNKDTSFPIFLFLPIYVCMYACLIQKVYVNFLNLCFCLVFAIQIFFHYFQGHTSFFLRRLVQRPPDYCNSCLEVMIPESIYFLKNSTVVPRVQE